MWNRQKRSPNEIVKGSAEWNAAREVLLKYLPAGGARTEQELDSAIELAVICRRGAMRGETTAETMARCVAKEMLLGLLVKFGACGPDLARPL